MHLHAFSPKLKVFKQNILIHSGFNDKQIDVKLQYIMQIFRTANLLASKITFSTLYFQQSNDTNNLLASKITFSTLYFQQSNDIIIVYMC